MDKADIIVVGTVDESSMTADGWVMDGIGKDVPAILLRDGEVILGGHTLEELQIIRSRGDA